MSKFSDEKYINDNINDSLIRTLVLFYHEDLDQLKQGNFKVKYAKVEIIENITFIFYQFKNDKNKKKFIIHIFDKEQQKNDLFGPFDGYINTFNINLKQINYKNDKYDKIIRTIIKMKIKDLRKYCKQLDLKMVGTKKELISSILFKRLEIKKLLC